MNAPTQQGPIKVVPVLQGRASMMGNQRTLQLFGRVNDGPGTFNRYTVNVPALQQKPVREDQVCERLWRVRTATTEVVRTAVAPVDPLTRNEIIAASPSNTGLRGRGSFKLQLTVGSSAGLTTFECDLGQTIDIYGYQVACDILGPAGAYEVGSRRDQLTQLGPGTVADAIVGFSLNAIEESVGNREVLYTQHLFIPGGSTFTFPIPRFARKVKIYVDPVLGGGGVVDSFWQAFIGDPAVVTDANAVGTIQFDGVNGQTTLDQNCILPGDASFIETDNQAGTRFATIIWTIKP